MRGKLVPGVLLLVALAAVACAGGAETVAQSPQQPAAAAAPAPAAPAADPAAPVTSRTSSTTPAQPAPGDTMSEKPQYGGTFYYYNRREPPGLFEPHLPGGRRDARRPIGAAIEKLVAWDHVDGAQCSGGLSNEMAESWRFVDDRTVELKIKQGVMFHDKPPVNGREMVADDVVFSYNRAFERGHAPEAAKAVESIEATDKYTVKVTLNTNFPFIEPLLFAHGEGYILAKEAADADGEMAKPVNVIGTGPWVLMDYTPAVTTIFERHPNYWMEGLPYIQRMEMPIIRDSATRLAAFQTDKVDTLVELDIQQKEVLEKTRPDTRFIPCLSANYVGVDFRLDNPPFNDIRVRRAVSMLLDRDAVKQGFFKGFARNILSYSPNVDGILDPEKGHFPADVWKYHQYNPQEAKKLLTEAGFPNGFPIKVESTLSFGSPYNEQTEIVVSMLQQGGIDAQLVVYDREEWSARKLGRRYEFIGVSKGSAGTSNLQVENFLSGHQSDAPLDANPQRVNDPEVDRLSSIMLTHIDPQLRKQAIHDLQIRFAEIMYTTALPLPEAFFPVSSRVKGNVWINPVNIRRQTSMMLREAWISE